jgi:hypothetical protein
MIATVPSMEPMLKASLRGLEQSLKDDEYALAHYARVKQISEETGKASGTAHGAQIDAEKALRDFVNDPERGRRLAQWKQQVNIA